jgi:hypothetical protein
MLVRPAILFMRNVEVVCLRVPSAETVNRILAKAVIDCLHYTSLGEFNNQCRTSVTLTLKEASQRRRGWHSFVFDAYRIKIIFIRICSEFPQSLLT